MVGSGGDTELLKKTAWVSFNQKREVKLLLETERYRRTRFGCKNLGTLKLRKEHVLFLLKAGTSL